MSKKYILFVVMLICVLIITGCQKEKTKEVAGGWETVLSNQTQMLDDETLAVFEKATENYNEMDLELVAFLAKQVVSGDNYMFLAKDNGDKNPYKIVVIYKNLQGQVKIIYVNDFDYTEYVNENIKGNAEALSGGWNVVSTGKPIMLDQSIQSAFDKATETLIEISLNPIAVLGKQIVSGTNYAILCYGRITESSLYSIYLITLYEDLNGKAEIVSQAYVNLSDYNK